MTRFVVRPKAIFGTPKRIATALNCKLRFYPNPDKPNRLFDYNRDFFTTPIASQHVMNAPADYTQTLAFATRNKYGQRQILAAYVPTPGEAATPSDASTLGADSFVVRPLRHSGGTGYRTTTDRLDFIPGAEYISELYRKRREYRVIFVLGKPLIVLRKKPNEGVTDDAPWGHENSKFQTINDVPSSRLAQTDCIARLADCPVVRGAHICAADVLYNNKLENPYVVLELNFCPGIDIDNNLEKVVEAIRAR